MASWAVQRGHAGLAQAVSEVLQEQEPEAPLELYVYGIMKANELGTTVIRQECLDALAAAGVSKPGCFARTYIYTAVPVLFLAVLLGDELAARRLLRLGFTLEALDLEEVSMLTHADPHVVGGYETRLKPVDLRFQVAQDTLRQLFKSALLRSRSTLLATRRRGLWRLGELPPGLLERIAGFAAEQTEAEEGFQEELKRRIGRDPLDDFTCRADAVGRQVELAPATADAPAQTPPRALPGQQPSEQLAQTLAGAPEESAASEPRGLPSGGPPASSSVGPVRGAAGAEVAAPEKDLAEVLQAQQDLHLALLHSKAEKQLVELAFNEQVYALLRLSKNQREISEHLLSSEELLPCRRRVEEAGCKLQPDWAGGALLLVPMTPELYLELSLELKGHHVLMLQSDVHLLEAAVRALHCRGRPQVKWDHRAEWYDGPGAFRSEGSPSEVPAEEDTDQEEDQATGSAGRAEVAGLGVAMDADWLCRYGIMKEDIHIPANHFDLSVASASAVAKSAPAGPSGQAEGAQERQRQPGSGPGLHDCNPRLWSGCRPAED